ncbi:MAG: DUF3078 domain-containing protein [Bacteroidales bacterium]|nr:DUF3078 domain-containing protein [Bacteroidales bacterium]
MKKILIIFLVLPFIVFSQEVPDSLRAWQKGGIATLNFSQVSLTNWAAGGNSSASGVLIFKSFANYKKDKLVWDNSIDLSYGGLKEMDKDFVKSNDKIELNSKLGIQAKDSWYYSGIIGFKSQFAAGYNDSDTRDIISQFMAPGYLTAGLGMDYKREKLSILIAPLSGKFTFIMDDKLAASGDLGVDLGSNSRGEFGVNVKFEYKNEILKNVTLETSLDMFSNYFNNPENIDIDWNVLINMKINEYLSANLVSRLIYDDDIKILDSTGKSAPRVQFMEMFGVGLSLKF